MAALAEQPVVERVSVGFEIKRPSAPNTAWYPELTVLGWRGRVEPPSRLAGGAAPSIQGRPDRDRGGVARAGRPGDRQRDR